MHSLPGWPGVSTAYHQSPPTTGKTLQGRSATWPGPEPAEVVREEKMTPDMKCNGKSGP